MRKKTEEDKNTKVEVVGKDEEILIKGKSILLLNHH